MTDEYLGSSKVSTPCHEFLSNLLEMKDQSDTMYKFMSEGGAYRKWNQGWGLRREVSPWNMAEAHDTTFSRSKELDRQYDRIYTSDSPGTDGDAKAVKLQAAYLQAMERAYNLRHATLARSEALASGRRKGQADDRGPFVGPSGVLGYVQRIIEKSQV